jgi:proton glutamate symport protein
MFRPPRASPEAHPPHRIPAPVSLTLKLLIGLLAGLFAGIAISLNPSPALLAIVDFIRPIGTIWVNAIRMTVIPLVVSSLIVGIAAAPDVRSVGRIGWRAIVVFVATVALAATFAAVVGQPLLGALDIDPATAATLRESGATATEASGASAEALPTFGQWLTDLIPVNPIGAMAEGAMLPIIMFSVAFGIAVLALPAERRAPLTNVLQSVFDATLQLVRWILELAPIGVFALALPLAVTMGVQAFGALGYYVVLVSTAAVLFTIVVLYPAAFLLGGVPLGRFARAAAPAQAVALSARSSLAALPAMIEGAQRFLHLPPAVTSFFLPLAASVFRAGTGVGATIGALFLARLYDVPLTATQLITVVVVVVVTSFSVPSIPGGTIIVMIPVLQAAGIPIAGIGLLLSIDTIPDMFRTATNVTGHLATATIVSRGEPSAPIDVQAVAAD